MTFRSVPQTAEDVRAFFAIDTFADRVVDAVGSGDALLAYATLALFATRSAVIGSILGSLAAAVECEHDGNVPVAPAGRAAQARALRAQRQLSLTPCGGVTAIEYACRNRRDMAFRVASAAASPPMTWLPSSTP